MSTQRPSQKDGRLERGRRHRAWHRIFIRPVRAAGLSVFELVAHALSVKNRGQAAASFDKDRQNGWEYAVCVVQKCCDVKGRGRQVVAVKTIEKTSAVRYLQ